VKPDGDILFLLAVLISIYSTIDGAAVKLTPAFFHMLCWLLFLSPVLTVPFMFRRYGWQTLKTKWFAKRWRLAAIA
jgi:hypothetical protein